MTAVMPLRDGAVAHLSIRKVWPLLSKLSASCANACMLWIDLQLLSLVPIAVCLWGEDVPE
jgi:hypothetical protein